MIRALSKDAEHPLLKSNVIATALMEMPMLKEEKMRFGVADVFAPIDGDGHWTLDTSYVTHPRYQHATGHAVVVVQVDREGELMPMSIAPAIPGGRTEQVAMLRGAGRRWAVVLDVPPSTSADPNLFGITEAEAHAARTAMAQDMPALAVFCIRKMMAN